MRIALHDTARTLLERLPRATVYSVLELVLLSLLAVQCARLVWTLVTPIGPVGDWRTASALQPAATDAAGLLGSFDPFFRLGGQTGPVLVTSLNLKLYGVRQDQASGRGSAIIATPDGQQRSFAVGEEIVPGVTLNAVDFDSVTISRGGATEQLFMDQSPPAQVVGPGAAPVQPPPPMAISPAPPGPASVPAPRNPAADIRFQPRVNGRQVTGVAVFPQGSGDGFRAAGLAPGDVIVAVNGRRIASAEQAQAIGAELAASRQAILQVERDGRVMAIRVTGSRQ